MNSEEFSEILNILNETEEEYTFDEFCDWEENIANKHVQKKCICQYEDEWPFSLDTAADACPWGRYETSNIDEIELVKEFFEDKKFKNRRIISLNHCDKLDKLGQYKKADQIILNLFKYL